MSERQAPPRCIDSPDPTTLAVRIEAGMEDAHG